MRRCIVEYCTLGDEDTRSQRRVHVRQTSLFANVRFSRSTQSSSSSSSPARDAARNDGSQRMDVGSYDLDIISGSSSQHLCVVSDCDSKSLPSYPSIDSLKRLDTSTKWLNYRTL